MPFNPPKFSLSSSAILWHLSVKYLYSCCFQVPAHHRFVQSNFRNGCFSSWGLCCCICRLCSLENFHSALFFILLPGQDSLAIVLVLLEYVFKICIYPQIPLFFPVSGIFLPSFDCKWLMAAGGPLLSEKTCLFSILKQTWQWQIRDRNC